jgi:hypothetical protein
MRPLIALLVLAPTAAHAYGEAPDGWPGPQERALHFFTDQLRVDPDATDPQFSTYVPVRPLIHAEELNESARFYADDMAANGCFPADHSSCDGTSFGDRLAMFYAGRGIGENILKGLSAADASVFDGWLYSDGHRENMLSPDWVELGTGYAPEGSHWVQDFGIRDGIEEPIATSGTHWPLTGSGGGSTRWYLAVHDPEGPVDRVEVIVDGARHRLDADRGTASSGTFVTELDNDGDACREYAFEVHRGSGDVIRYPTAGWLLATVGGAACEPWIDAPPPADGDGLGSGGNGCSEDGGNDAGPGSNQTEGNVELGRCSLDRARGVSSLALILGALVPRRRRR